MPREKSILAGKTLKLKDPFKDHMDELHHEVTVEDWWENIAQETWLDSAEGGNLACINYALRVKRPLVKTWRDVLYCRTGYFGNLFHISELEV